MHQLKTAPHGLGMDGVDVDDLDGDLRTTGADASWRRTLSWAVGRGRRMPGLGRRQSVNVTAGP
jgi:hypothetical protein